MKLYDMSDWCKRGPEIEKYPYIGEVKINATDCDIGELLAVGGDIYSFGMLGVMHNRAGVRKINLNPEPEDCDYESELTCPYCGYRDRDSWELNDSDDEHICQRCGAAISYERVVTVEYNSSPVRPPNSIVQTEWANQ